MTIQNLPAGLVVHCESCGIVIPADAPRPEGGDCAYVARNRLTHFRPNETIKGQHTMATAAWHMIYHRAITGPSPDAAAVAYLNQYRANPKQHFVSSAVRCALTPEKVAEQITRKPPDIRLGDWQQVAKDVLRIATNRRDAHFYTD